MMTLQIMTLLAPILMGIAVLIAQHYHSKRHDDNLKRVDDSLKDSIKRVDDRLERVSERLSYRLSRVENLLAQVVSWLKEYTGFSPVNLNKSENILPKQAGHKASARSGRTSLTGKSSKK